MCGIFGAVFLPPHARVHTEAVLNVLRSRGPDAHGTRRTAGEAFAHTRLRVVDLSDAGAQPMRDEDADCTLVFNGEIYNHVELRHALEARGVRFHSRSDTEVILRGYIEFGDRIVERLDGMFAFGLWDGRQKRLLMARDRVGKKPLFYTHGTPEIRFASTARALLASGLTASFDPEVLPSLLTFGFPRAPRSMFRGIAQLPPAHTMVVAEGQAPRIERYHQSPFRKAEVPYGVEEASVELRRLMESAVAKRLVADVPVGAFLSGGLDSSIVVGLASKLSPEPLRTFSIGYPDEPRFDETEFAQIVANHFGTAHTVFKLEPVGLEAIAALVDEHDGPFGDSSALPTSVVSSLAREHAVVALTGDGGDELFAGYIRFLVVNASEHFPGKFLQHAGKVASTLSRGTRDPLARAGRLLHRAGLPLADRMLSWQTFFGFELDEMLIPGAVSAAAHAEPALQSRALIAGMEDRSALRRILHFNYETYLPDDLLVKVDRASMMHGLEARSPFLDTELTAFVASLPDHMKVRGLTTKWLLRHAFRDQLPKVVTQRRKMGFGVPLGTWFRTSFRSFVNDYFQSNSPVFDYLDRRFVQTLLEQHFGGRSDHGHRIWLLLTFAVWLERYRSYSGEA